MCTFGRGSSVQYLGVAREWIRGWVCQVGCGMYVRWGCGE